MSKTAISSQAFCGIDVSAATLAVAVQRADLCGFEQREFPNSAPGHRQLVRWLHKRGVLVRVSLEATGIYSLDLALALDEAEGIEVAVLNPKTANRFAQTLGRSKTDKADALALAEYCQRMPFVAWRPPSRAVLALRSISRYVAGLTGDRVRLSNRLHTAMGSSTTPQCVRQDLKSSIDRINKRIAQLRRQAVAMIGQDPVLKSKFDRLVAMPGIAETSAVQLLGELASLDPDMTVRQWVAHSGLDPAHRQSGTSVPLRSRISRHGNSHLRRALYMPALVAARHDRHLRQFYQALQARHKTKLQAIMAVARKLLHAIFGIFKTGTAYDGAKLFPKLIPTS
jgi:transposase